MAKNYVQKGRIVNVVAPANIDAGKLLVVGGMFGVTEASCASGGTVGLNVEGVYNLPKVAATTFTAGEVVYWSTASPWTLGVINSASAAAVVKIGAAIAAAASGPTSVAVRLNGVFPVGTG